MTYTRRSWLLSVLLLSEVAVAGVFIGGTSLNAMTLPQRKYTPWKIFTAADVAVGVLVPQDTNVIFSVPPSVTSIDREVLLGHQGLNIRYWGYCFPQNTDPAPTHGLFPGKLFLSEAERAAREAAQPKTTPNYSLTNLPTQAELNASSQSSVNGVIRHQVEIFHGGQTCYLMTSKALYMGLDDDGDGLNNAEERKYNTNPKLADTDADGLSDGEEVLKYHTNPLNPDTDRDGLADGEEVHTYHTNPTSPDTDRDGLCDGYCQMDVTGNFCGTVDGSGTTITTGSGVTTTYTSTVFKCISTNRWAGEEAKVLSNGLDTWQSDPTKWSTLGDGVSDFQRYYKQLFDSQTITH